MKKLCIKNFKDNYGAITFCYKRYSNDRYRDYYGNIQSAININSKKTQNNNICSDCVAEISKQLLARL